MTPSPPAAPSSLAACLAPSRRSRRCTRGILSMLAVAAGTAYATMALSGMMGGLLPLSPTGSSPVQVVSTGHQQQQPPEERALWSPGSSRPTEAGVAASPPNPWLTYQACRELPDGTSEICDYEGPLCMDMDPEAPSDLYVGAPTQARYGTDHRVNARDPRTGLLKLHRVMSRGLGLPNLPPEAYADPRGWAHSRASVSPLDPTRVGRLWGPEFSGQVFRETSWEAIAAATSPEDLAWLGPAWAAAAATAADPATLAARHASLGARVTQYDGGIRLNDDAVGVPSRVTWLRTRGAWIADLGHSPTHIYHFTMNTIALWAGKRANGSMSSLPFGPNLPGRAFRVAHGTAGGPLPPMDHVLFRGSYDKSRGGWRGGAAGPLHPWTRGILPLLLQNATQLLLNGDMREAAGLPASGDPKSGAGHWLCAPRAAVGSLMYRWFASAADAAAFRLLAYALANVTSLAAPAYPPRRILVLQRGTRGFPPAEMKLLGALLDEVGLPWGLGPTTEAWEEQVRAYAGTGILIAPHGAALSNLPWMPTGAVVIELFPFHYRPPMYGQLAASLGLGYYPIAGRAPPRGGEGDPTWSLFFEPGYIAKCDSNASHPSNLDGAWVESLPCGRGKDTAVHIDMPLFTSVLEQALDDIGCRDSHCAVEVGGPYVALRRAAAVASAGGGG